MTPLRQKPDLLSSILDQQYVYCYTDKRCDRHVTNA